ncbi:hypothetical protein RI129_012692 [Pyrocoelia pectoralis]|uniref:N-acyl-aliphatic-L-amino acid amidohydrolase n=1 Tax=Pyrocoelia pectoralis TaxID=417401 RepID=A0AAN7UYP8_9COLE
MSQILDALSPLDRQAVDKFREYLRIPTVHPDIDYEPCIKFLEQYARDLGIPVKVYRNIPTKPVAVFKWEGKESGLSTIMLNGHMDVVPVYRDKWTYEPFGAEIDDKGYIYGRGAQDMKWISILYLEAIRRLKLDGVVPKRTVYVFFVPDEEYGELGLREFVKTKEFRNLNIGFGLDEGDSSPNDSYIAYYGEKSCWQFTIHCPGQTGHASLILKNTAGEKVRYLVDKFSDFRRTEEKKLEDDSSLKLWDVTSVNLTQLGGGVQPNVVPEELTLTYDVRISPGTNVKDLERKINRWCKEAGDGIWLEYYEKEAQRPITVLENSPYWSALAKVAEKRKINLEKKVCLGATDVRFLREMHIPAIGISPMRFTKPLAHDHDECVNVRAFLEGLQFYYDLLPELANV